MSEGSRGAGRGRGGLVVYVTSHGFGHMNRTVAVLNLIPSDVPLAIRCHPDLFDHWRQRLNRPAALEPYHSDAGTAHPPGDSAKVDGRASLERAIRLHHDAWAKLDEEVARLRTGRVSAVLCDGPWVPLEAAFRAGVPAFALANFLWSEIYEEHAEAAGPEAMELVGTIRRCHGHATATFRTPPALALDGAANIVDVGMVLATGLDRKRELREKAGARPGDRLVSLYVGRYGQEGLPWQRLADLRDVVFVSFHDLPPGVTPAPRWHVVGPGAWTGADLAASVDAVVAKAGYGSVCEALAAGTPMIYPPREGFAEFAALDHVLRCWSGGVPISEEEFLDLDLSEALETALALRPGPCPYPTDGAETVAGELLRHLQAIV